MQRQGLQGLDLSLLVLLLWITRLLASGRALARGFVGVEEEWGGGSQAEPMGLCRRMGTGGRGCSVRIHSSSSGFQVAERALNCC